MPQAVNIVLANGETTPVNHTFIPSEKDRDGFFWFEDQSPRVAATSPLGWPRIGIRSKRAKPGAVGANSKNLVNVVDYVIQLPSLETLGTSDNGLTPPPTISYIDRARGTFYLHARDTVADRKDVIAYNKNLMSNALVIDLVHNLTSLYG